MKIKLISIVFFASLFTFKMASAQSLTLSHEGEDVSNGKIIVQASEDTPAIKTYINITNQSDNMIMVGVKRTVIKTYEGVSTSFCFFEQCLPPFIDESEPKPINAGETTEDSDFYVEFVPNGKIGEAEYMYTVFNSQDPDDNVTVNIKYYIGVPVSVPVVENIEFKAYPNPAYDDVYIDYTLSDRVDKQVISLYNMLGLKVFEQKLTDQSGRVQINTTQLAKGIYFYALENGERALVTKKLIIK